MTDDPNSIRSLKKLSRKRQDIDIDAFWQSLGTESDRAAIILVACGLEDTLYLVLSKHLTNWTELDDLEDLFGINRPLSSFSAKIDLAYFSSLIATATREQLHTIREMRNFCAHNQYPLGFTTPELASVCRRLFAPRGVVPAPLANDAPALRDAFLMETNLLDHTIMLGSRDASLSDMAADLASVGLPIPSWLQKSP